MGSGERLYTAEEFWEKHSDLPGDRLHELVKGVIVEAQLPGAAHRFTVSAVASTLHIFVRSMRLGLVTIQSGFALFGNPDTVRGPDVAFVAAERVPDPLP